MHICAIYEVTGINHVTRRTIHIFRNLHFMLLVGINEFRCHVVHIDYTAFIPDEHIDVILLDVLKYNQLQHLPHMFLSYMYWKQICLANCTYIKYLWETYIEGRTYMGHIWSHWHHSCDQECCTLKNPMLITMTTMPIVTAQAALAKRPNQPKIENVLHTRENNETVPRTGER